MGLFDADTCRFGFCSLFLMLLVSVVGVCLLIVWSSRVVKNVAQDYSFPDRAKKRKQSGTQSTHFSLNRLTSLSIVNSDKKLRLPHFDYNTTKTQQHYSVILLYNATPTHLHNHNIFKYYSNSDTTHLR